MRNNNYSWNKKRHTIFVTKHPVNYAVLKASSLDDVDWLKFKYDAGHTKVQCIKDLCLRIYSMKTVAVVVKEQHNFANKEKESIQS